jgi:glycosyltransferase involved in cell wall biosynthesis
LSLKVIAWPKCKNKNTNPFQSLLYSSIEKKENVQVVEFSLSSFIFSRGDRVLHIHWPDVFLASSKGSMFWIKLTFMRALFFIARLLQIPVVWTAHNLKRAGQQNSNLLERFFWPWFSKRIDAVIYMTESSKLMGDNLFNQKEKFSSVVIPHGHYHPVISDLNILVPCIVNKKPELLFFGSITKYKNAYKLLNAFLTLPIGTASLSIRGKMSTRSPDTLLCEKLKCLTPSQKEEVLYENRFIDDEELVKAINQSELVVFPYSDVLNSGAAIFALSVGSPILASDTSLFRELQSQVGKAWVQLIDGELDSNQLSAAIHNACLLKELGEKPNLSAFEWDNIAEQTLSFYNEVLVKGYGAN